MEKLKKLLTKKIIITFLFSHLVLLFLGGLFVTAGILAVFIASGDSENEGCPVNPTEEVAASSIEDQGKEKNAEEIYRYLTETEGATPQGATGVMGTMEFESHFDPTAENPSSGAYGLAQWLGSRKDALKAFAVKEKQEMSDLGTQLAFLSQELDDPAYKKAKKALKSSDISKAQKEWLLWYEGLSEDSSQWFLGQRNAMAKDWYAKFSTSDPAASSAIENAAEDQSNATDCNEESPETEESDGNILKTAKSLTGYFHYSQPKRKEFGSVQTPDKNGFADCSSFVWLVLAKAGYKTPENVEWFTGSMSADAQGKKQYLTTISPKKGKAGDVIIVNQGSGAGNDGHTAILAESWHGLETKIIEQGGMQKQGVGEGQVDLSFGYLLKGGDLSIARPIKK